MHEVIVTVAKATILKYIAYGVLLRLKMIYQNWHSIKVSTKFELNSIPIFTSVQYLNSEMIVI